MKNISISAFFLLTSTHFIDPDVAKVEHIPVPYLWSMIKGTFSGLTYLTPDIILLMSFCYSGV